MTIGAFDARRCAVPWTGIGQYATVLRAALPLAMGSRCPQFIHGGGLRVRTSGVPVPQDVLVRRRKMVFEQVALPAWTLSRRPSFLHVPWYEGPWAAACPLIINVHDIDTILSPGRYSTHFRLYYNGLLRRYARSAAALLVLSECTARDLAHHLHPRVEPDVIPLSAAPEFFTADPLAGRRLLEELGAPAGQPVAVSASGTGRRKNLVTVGRALAMLAKEGLAVTLVVTQTERVPDALLPAAGAGVAILPAGVLRRSQVANLMAAAALSICPSLYEGFGLAVVESMAAGCPVIASTAGSHPEVAGDAALLFEAESPGELADCLRALLGDAALRERLRSRGRERAGQYSWDETVRRTIKVYERFA